MTTGIITDQTGTYLVLRLAPCDVQSPKKDPKWWLTQEVAVRANIQTALELSQNNLSRAADALGINRRTLQRNLFWDTGLGERIRSWKGRREVVSAHSQT